MTEPRELSVYHAGELMRRGELSAEALTRSCLERIAARDPGLRAWVHVDAEGALEAARGLDDEARRLRWQGPLHGIPVGIKDIIDVKGMWTRGGTEAYPARLCDADAAAVARLRTAGAVVLGKTVTTPLAYIDPAETRNPWHPEHTPGGSSSGSAAGVADRMCLAALGTQTGGSVSRPAAYNGIVGFKPTYTGISLTGVIPAAWQFDTLGTFTRSVGDAHLLWHLLRRDRTLNWQATRDKLPPALLPRAPQRVWRMRGYFAEQAEPEADAAVEAVCGLLRGHGVEVVEWPLPPSFQGIHDAHMTIMSAETAAYNALAYERYPESYPPKLTQLIEDGLERTAVDYVAARQHRWWFQEEMDERLAQVDVAITPAAPGAAPRDRTTTGSARFNAPWTLCGTPTLALPIRLDAAGLPLSLQVIGREEHEEALLAVGGWLESILGFDARPPE